MPRFNDLLNTLGGLEGQYPDTLLDDLMSAYDGDIAELGDSHSAALGETAAQVDELTVANAELNTIIAGLKQHNYDLLMAAPAASVGSEGDSGEDESDEDGEDITIDSLFDDGDEN